QPRRREVMLLSFSLRAIVREIVEVTTPIFGTETIRHRTRTHFSTSPRGLGRNRNGALENHPPEGLECCGTRVRIAGGRTLCQRCLRSREACTGRLGPRS